MADGSIGLTETSEIESPESTAVETESTAVETTDTGVEGAETEGEPETEPKGIPAIANGKLSEAARNTLKEIGTKDPALAKSLKTALYEQEALRRIMPDGIKGVQALRQQLEEIGAPEKVQAVREELSSYEDLDNAYTSGDPRFIERITNTPEGKAAFLQLAPVVFDKFLEMNPDGYSAYIGKTFVADMISNEVPIALKLLQYAIKDNPAAMEEWNKLAAYYDRLNGWAKKPVTAPKIEKSSVDEEREKFESEKQEFTRNQWMQAAQQQRAKIYDAEFKRLTAGRKLNDKQEASLKVLYVHDMLRKLRENKNVDSISERFLANGDQAGFLKHIAAFDRAEVPRSLKAALDAYLPSKPGPKATPGITPPKPGIPGTGFSWISGPPKKDTIDFSRTRADDIRQGRAVLIGGKKVQWKTSEWAKPL